MQEKKIFKIDLQDLAPSRKSLSTMFSTIDQHFLNSFSERRDLIRQYRDIPVPLNQLYTDSNYIINRHGNDLQIQLDVLTQQKATKRGKKRTVQIVKDSFSVEEEHVFQRLHKTFQRLGEQNGNKSIFEVTDAFMRCSGDVQALEKLLKGAPSASQDPEGEDNTLDLIVWTYQDDIALSMPENSGEFRDLLARKGRLEIDKRKIFLLGAGCQQKQITNSKDQQQDVEM